MNYLKFYNDVDDQVRFLTQFYVNSLDEIQRLLDSMYRRRKAYRTWVKVVDIRNVRMAMGNAQKERRALLHPECHVTFVTPIYRLHRELSNKCAKCGRTFDDMETIRVEHDKGEQYLLCQSHKGMK